MLEHLRCLTIRRVAYLRAPDAIDDAEEYNKGIEQLANRFRVYATHLKEKSCIRTADQCEVNAFMVAFAVFSEDLPFNTNTPIQKFYALLAVLLLNVGSDMALRPSLRREWYVA